MHLDEDPGSFHLEGRGLPRGEQLIREQSDRSVDLGVAEASLNDS